MREARDSADRYASVKSALRSIALSIGTVAEVSGVESINVHAMTCDDHLYISYFGINGDTILFSSSEQVGEVE